VEVRVQKLEGNLAVELGIESRIHYSHGTLSEFPEENIPADIRSGTERDRDCQGGFGLSQGNRDLGRKRTRGFGHHSPTFQTGGDMFRGSYQFVVGELALNKA
jgi:hypothetical protein